MYNCLRELNIPCTLILDSAVGYIMERVDMVMVGAECVVESGGIINKVIQFIIYYQLLFIYYTFKMSCVNLYLT